MPFVERRRFGGRPRRGRSLALVVLVLVAAWIHRNRLESSKSGRSAGAPTIDAPAVDATSTPVEAAARVGPCAVTKVVDGDTLHVRMPDAAGTDERIRLLRINTPERGHPGYERATAALLALVGGKSVELEWEKPGVPARDDFGRLLAYVWVGDGDDARLVNLELMRQGFTRFFTKYGEGRRAGEFRAAETAAQTANAGLWSADGWNSADERAAPAPKTKAKAKRQH